MRNPTSSDPADVTPPQPKPTPPQTMSDLESRWPSVNLEEQRRLYARIEALRVNLLGSRPPPKT